MRHFGAKAKSVTVALATALALSGCTVPIINVELPFDLPDLSGYKFPLPHIDLSGLNLPTFTLPIGVTTSVDDARQSVLVGNASSLSEGALVTPGYLTVGVKAATSSAPLCIVGDAGSLYGLDVDIAAAVASDMGLKVRYVAVTGGDALGTQCDVIMSGKTDNPDYIAIAGTYVESATAFFYRGDPTVLASTDLGGKSVGVQSGSQSEALLNSTGLKMSQKSYLSLNDAFDALAAGEVDFVLCEAYPGAYLASLHKGISFVGAMEAPETSGIAVLTSNTELVNGVQSSFATISQNGVLEVIRSRWVGTMPPLTTDSQIANIPEGDGSAPAAAPSESADTGDGSEAGANAITSI